MPPKCPTNAPQAPAKPPKHAADTRVAVAASKPLAGLPGLPPDLRAFLRNRSVTEIADLLRLGKGTASRIKRGIYPHAPNKLLKRWEAVRAAGTVPVGTWALRRVMADATVHEAVLWRGMLYSGAGLLGMRGRQIAVAPTADGGLLAQTLDLPPQRLPLTLVGEAEGTA
jgi:hypothetical protein